MNYPILPVISNATREFFVNLDKYPKRQILGWPGCYTAPLVVDRCISLGGVSGFDPGLSGATLPYVALKTVVLQAGVEVFELDISDRTTKSFYPKSDKEPLDQEMAGGVYLKLTLDALVSPPGSIAAAIADGCVIQGRLELVGLAHLAFGTIEVYGRCLDHKVTWPGKVAPLPEIAPIRLIGYTVASEIQNCSTPSLFF